MAKARKYFVNGTIVEIKKTDYKWATCWGAFDTDNKRWLTKDITLKLLLQWVKDNNGIKIKE